MFRQLAARANNMAMDRADIQFAVKEMCRSMANPTIGSWRQLKRLARYLKKRPQTVVKFDFQERSHTVDGYSDSDWAGCRRTGRSTSGGPLIIGNHFIKSWSSTQKNITLSSAEVELVASVNVWRDYWIGKVGCRLGTRYESEDPCRFFSGYWYRTSAR